MSRRKRIRPDVEVRLDNFETGEWWSASVTLGGECFISGGYRRSRYAAVRGLECKLKLLRNDIDAAVAWPEIAKLKTLPKKDGDEGV